MSRYTIAKDRNRKILYRDRAKTRPYYVRTDTRAAGMLSALKVIRDFARGSKLDPQANFPAIEAIAENAIAMALAPTE